MIFLYVKQHALTKLKYFGKTSSNPLTYRGSGTYWKRHLKQHGNEVDTLQVWEFSDQSACTQFALQFSEQNDIVNSDRWANLIEENGVDGMPKGTKVKNPGGTYVNVNTGERKRMLKSDVNPAEGWESINKGFALYQNAATNEVRRLRIDDPQVISGNFVGYSKGKKFFINRELGTVKRASQAPEGSENYHPTAGFATFKNILTGHMKYMSVDSPELLTTEWVGMHHA